MGIHKVFKKNGFSDEQILKINRCKALWNISEDDLFFRITSIFEFLFALKLAKNEAIEKITRWPNILSFSLNNIGEKYSHFIDLGYTGEQVAHMFKGMPSIFGYSINSIDNRIEFLRSKGFTLDEVIYMIYGNPQILSYDKNKLDRKLDFILSCGFRNLIVNKPKELMQSYELTVARYNFLANIDFKFKNGYELFIPQKDFQKKFNLNNEQVIYHYYDDVENEENRLKK